jgi:ribosomal protein S12 methylthiotransferase accessory factor
VEITVGFTGGKKVAARFDGHTVLTDQPVDNGGEGSAPSPFDLFLASLATCAGFFVMSFCQQRGISTEGIALRQNLKWDEAKHLASVISLEITVPENFPEKYRASLVNAANLCTVKRHLQSPPAFEITTRRA